MPAQVATSSAQPGRKFAVSQRTPDDDTSVVAVEGELDLATAPSLKRTLLEALHGGARRLIVDLTLVTFMDSTALGVLVGLTRSLGPDVHLAIACSQPNVLRIFEFSGLDGAFAIHPTLEQALAQTPRREAWSS